MCYKFVQVESFTEHPQVIAGAAVASEDINQFTTTL